MPLQICNNNWLTISFAILSLSIASCSAANLEQPEARSNAQSVTQADIKPDTQPSENSYLSKYKSCVGEIFFEEALENIDNIERQSIFENDEYSLRFVLYNTEVLLDETQVVTYDQCVIIDQSNNAVLFDSRGNTPFCGGAWDFSKEYPLWLPYSFDESADNRGYNFSTYHCEEDLES